jgi:protein phosphatase
MIRATSGVTTHVGQVRDGNEDNYVSIDGLYFVADGMGGHSAGEVASEIAVRIFRAGTELGIRTVAVAECLVGD